MLISFIQGVHCQRLRRTEQLTFVLEVIGSVFESNVHYRQTVRGFSISLIYPITVTFFMISVSHSFSILQPDAICPQTMRVPLNK
jgi:hypothetical protein